MTFRSVADAAPHIRRLHDAVRLTPHDPANDSFSPVVDRFFELAETPGFFDISEPCEDPVVMRAVGETVGRLLRASTAMPVFMSRVGGMVHGAAPTKDAQVVFFWFHDIAQGILIRFRPGHETDIVRMSNVLLPAEFAAA